MSNFCSVKVCVVIFFCYLQSFETLLRSFPSELCSPFMTLINGNHWGKFLCFPFVVTVSIAMTACCEVSYSTGRFFSEIISMPIKFRLLSSKRLLFSLVTHKKESLKATQILISHACRDLVLPACKWLPGRDWWARSLLKAKTAASGCWFRQGNDPKSVNIWKISVN